MVVASNPKNLQFKSSHFHFLFYQLYVGTVLTELKRKKEISKRHGIAHSKKSNYYTNKSDMNNRIPRHTATDKLSKRY